MEPSGATPSAVSIWHDVGGYATCSLIELGPNMAVVSVALPAKLGALSLVHFDDVVPPEQVESIIVPRLLVCAGEIAKALQEYRPHSE